MFQLSKFSKSNPTVRYIVKKDILFYEEEIETPPLYENQTFIYQFTKVGNYVIQCLNSIPFKAQISVIQNEMEISALQKMQQTKNIEQKPVKLQPKVDLYAPENRKLKMLGSQETSMASTTILEQIKEKCLGEDTNIDIVDLIMNNKSNSNNETVSTFNSSFQQPQNIVKIKTETYSDSGKSEFNTILDRKSSDPIVSTAKVSDRITLTRTKQQQLSVFDKIQFAILDSKHIEIDVQSKQPDFKKTYTKGLSIMNYLEIEYCMGISNKTNVINEIQN
ncbi:unnamed protein product (macronuclear) [Paramecium tetraurelia]|uniref:Uncharacterized protein n=1 Tax=Paramecium tetraurelia TaxID=5888 RepID=A0EDY9_PARTE|nr:uncharacterized protein GSPATT00025850001 [Paramecium tetraurelia]CAK93506.1 unnamed protein product [Paramecium tetraurelia]|eukprot:XP_001460903.1 hypothetical protein (macronuclear) [Paramecium tetraurelia strain d4-2]